MWLCKLGQKFRQGTLNIFCSRNTRSSWVFRGLEQLYSLLWRRVPTISKLGVIQPRFRFV